MSTFDSIYRRRADVLARTPTWLVFSVVALSIVPAAAAPVTIAWSQVGGSGNAADPSTGLGSVGYVYDIGTYDVTNNQYVAFLNSNDPTGSNKLGIFNDFMSDPTQGGIVTNPNAPAGGKYSVLAGDGNHPVNFVSFYDTLRFANWLDNGQVPGSTETGAYTLLGGTATPSNANDITRNSGAHIFLPSQQEWYKAAYYSPATKSYFLYPTSSNTAPHSSGPTVTPNSANYYGGGPGAPTDVGAYSGTTSPTGEFDMAGNLFQWNDTLFEVKYRGAQGGAWSTLSDQMISSFVNEGYTPGTRNIFGFRVASIFTPGDVNRDGIVNGLDIANVAGNWLHKGNIVAGDANGDGVVNGLDITVIASHWLHSQSSASAVAVAAPVPEPATWGLAGLGGLGVIVAATRRRCNAQFARQSRKSTIVSENSEFIIGRR